MRLVVIGLTLLAVAVGCGSAQGATTTTQASGTDKRAFVSSSQVHCATAMMQQTEVGVVVYCADIEALPLSGSCATNSLQDKTPTSLNVTLAVNEPVNWDGTAGAGAGWVCRWASNGAFVNVPTGQATICCASKLP